MLAALSYCGFQLAGNKELAYFFGIGIPVIIVLFWIQWMAPKAKQRLPVEWVILVSFLLFELSALALFLCGKQTWATILAITALINIGIKLISSYAGTSRN